MLTGFKSYQLSLQLYRECERVTAPHHLKDQLNRAALSVVLNLAEGSAKPTPKERRRFYSIALASTREVQALIEVIGCQQLWPLADFTSQLFSQLDLGEAQGVSERAELRGVHG